VLVEDALRQKICDCTSSLLPAKAYKLNWSATVTGLISIASVYGNWRADIAVWFYGEPGTGRMTGARYLHQLGRSAEGRLFAVN
jgi:hypothetical protein